MRSTIAEASNGIESQRKEIVRNFIMDFITEHHPTKIWLNFDEVLTTNIHLLRPLITDIEPGLYLWLEEAPLIGNNVNQITNEP